MRVDFKALERDIERLKEKRIKFIRAGHYGHAAAIDNELKAVEAKMEWMVNHEHETFGNLLRTLPEDDQRRWSRNCLLMILLADMLDTATTDVNSQLQKLSGMHINTYDTVKQIKALTGKIVHIFDRDSESDDMRVEWGELSDMTMLHVQNMANSFLAKKEAKEKEQLKK